jgi:hypothetical protein
MAASFDRRSKSTRHSDFHGISGACHKNEVTPIVYFPFTS